MRLVNREKELDELNRLLQQAPSQAQFLMVYGRRRIGKTSLLLHWVQQAQAAGWHYIYWAIREKPADALRAGRRARFRLCCPRWCPGLFATF